jgi:uncharacterized damage-inducible protein DinB
MREHLLHLSHYNLLANQKLLSFIPEDSFIWEREVKSSFKTIASTILHITDAQDIWLSRINGQSPSKWSGSDRQVQSPSDIGDLLIQSSHRFFLFIDSQLPTFPTKIIQYENMKGITYSNTVEEIVAHAMNHSTFHRGQVITMLRELGVDKLDSTDMISFFREIKERKKDVLD